MKKIFTKLEAKVKKENWILLEQNYAKIHKNDLPQALLSSYLIQNQADLETWEIITVWKSLEDLNLYRKSVEVPAWILVFRAAKAEPKLSIFDIHTSK